MVAFLNFVSKNLGEDLKIQVTGRQSDKEGSSEALLQKVPLEPSTVNSFISTT